MPTDHQTKALKISTLGFHNNCPGCTDHPRLPKIHLCSPPVGRIPTITHEQSRTFSSILPFSVYSTIPWMKGEIFLQTLLVQPVPIKRAA